MVVALLAGSAGRAPVPAGRLQPDADPGAAPARRRRGVRLHRRPGVGGGDGGARPAGPRDRPVRALRLERLHDRPAARPARAQLGGLHGGVAAGGDPARARRGAPAPARRRHPRRPSTRAVGSCCRAAPIRPGIGGGLAGVGIAAITGFVVLLCVDRGFGQTSGAIAIACFAGATLVGRLVAGGVPDRLGPRRTMGIAVALGGDRPGADRRRAGLVGGRARLRAVRLLLDAALPGPGDARGRRRGAVAARRRPRRLLELLRPRLRHRRAGARRHRLGARLRRHLRDRRRSSSSARWCRWPGGGGTRPSAALSFGRCGATTSRRTAAR